MLRIVHHADGSQKQVHLGWKKQHVDERDETYRLKLPRGLLTLPSSNDNRLICSEIEDQGDLGSCTSNMLAGMIESNEIKRSNSSKSSNGLLDALAASPTVVTSGISVASDGSISFKTKVTPAVTPAPTPTKIIQVSRLFGYYATRKIENTINEDSGATIRDTIKAGYTYGVADEAHWPYDISKFAQNPPQSVWTEAAAHKVTSYHSITDGDIATMKSTLVAGFLIGFGFVVYDYFMSADMAKKAFLPLPLAGEQVQGGHAVALVGYDDTIVNPFTGAKGAFLVRNSWGKKWGMNGYFWLSYDYIMNTRLASDFWVIQSCHI